MKQKSLLSMALMCITTVMMAKPAKTVTLRLVETSDVHGAFFPYDFIERRPMRGTMARVAAYVKRQRREFGRNLILLDNGDILQGQPTCYWTNYVNTSQTNLAADVLNYIGYDAQVLGNHDVETGHAVYDKWIRELNSPTLGANIIDVKSGKPYVEPYLMMEREGVRIAVLGMLTPAIPNWLQESLWSGMRFEEMVTCARRWVKVLREKEEADIVVGLFHSGWDGGISTPDYDEDAARKVAEQVEGFDVIFFGHDHRARQETVNGVLCLDPANNAVNVAQATITVSVEQNTANGKRPLTRIIRKTGEIVDITGEVPDPDFVSHFQPRIDAISQWANRQIGTFATPMYSREAFFGPCAFIDYVHDLQLEHTRADLSLNAPVQFNTVLKAGPVRVSDMFKLYRYENQIYVLRMTGSEVRRHLEMSYDLWVNTMTTPGDHIMRLTERTVKDQQRMGFENFTFNFDSAAGIDYEVDVTRPDGQKVNILGFSDGRPFREDVWYRVAMNSYRGNGGGELLTRGAGIPKDSLESRIVYRSQYDLRHYLTKKIEQEQTAAPQAHNNWRFVPADWAEPAIRRDRELLFGE